MEKKSRLNERKYKSIDSENARSNRYVCIFNREDRGDWGMSQWEAEED